jgi:hypothetical protein
MRPRTEIEADIEDGKDQVARLIVDMVKLTVEDAQANRDRVVALRVDALRAQSRLYRLMAELVDYCAETGESVSGMGPGMPPPNPFAGTDIPDALPEDL